ncbi:DUF3566 domain-containing protein [Micropruina sp.]|uniref:DUF3566 domain-containing protein n=1 Tax=Micropruina sp. TaxID=2737536 RepID=UPI0039E4787F
MSDQQGKTRTSSPGNVWGSAPAGGGASDLYRSDERHATPDFEAADETRVQPAVTDQQPAPTPARPAVVSSGPRSVSRRTRKARLRLSRIDPWSVMKTSFLFSIAFGIMFWFATYVVWSVIGASGLFDAVNSILQNLLSNPNDQTQIRIEDFVNTNKVLGIAALIAVINVVLLTAIGTLTAFLYNLSANILGGLELTLAED